MHNLYAMGHRDGQDLIKARSADDTRLLVERIELLERLIEKYATHVANHTGVYFLEDRFRETLGGHERFTDEEWEAIRLLAKEDNG